MPLHKCVCAKHLKRAGKMLQPNQACNDIMSSSSGRHRHQARSITRDQKRPHPLVDGQVNGIRPPPKQGQGNMPHATTHVIQSDDDDMEGPLKTK